jgi:hypothetical protein
MMTRIALRSSIAGATHSDGPSFIGSSLQEKAIDAQVKTDCAKLLDTF